MARKAREFMGRTARLGLAAAGFFGGYLWGVRLWAEHWGLGADQWLGAAGSGALVATTVYVFSLALLFGPALIRRAGVFDTIAPAAFVLSFFLGTGGIRAALWLAG